MMVSMPSASSLTDLSTLLQLLQAASDPKTAADVIAKLRGERKQYDDAIVAADERTRRALAAEASADLSVAQAAQAETIALANINALNIKSAEVAEEVNALKAQKSELRRTHAELVARDQEQDERAAALGNQAVEFAAECLKERKAIEGEWELARIANGEAVALKTDYEAKLAKFKALTE